MDVKRIPAAPVPQPPDKIQIVLDVEDARVLFTILRHVSPTTPRNCMRLLELQLQKMLEKDGGYIRAARPAMTPDERFSSSAATGLLGWRG